MVSLRNQVAIYVGFLVVSIIILWLFRSILLPFIVGLLVYLSSPTYIMPLFTTSTGHLILGVSAFWMSIGVFVMKKMINFDF